MSRVDRGGFSVEEFVPSFPFHWTILNTEVGRKKKRGRGGNVFHLEKAVVRKSINYLTPIIPSVVLVNFLF